MADETTEARRPVTPMAPKVAEALAGVKAAREGVATELDNLNTSVRAAVDIPAKIKRNPVPTLGAAGGAAFLLLGGPKRVAQRRLTVTPPIVSLAVSSTFELSCIVRLAMAATSKPRRRNAKASPDTIRLVAD